MPQWSIEGSDDLDAVRAEHGGRRAVPRLDAARVASGREPGERAGVPDDDARCRRPRAPPDRSGRRRSCCTGHRTVSSPADSGRYLATHIPDAKFVLVPGDDHVPWTADADALLDEIEEFLTGQRHGSADRVLTTVLFTDIVDSTTRAAELGDAAWRDELDAHDAIVRAQLGRFGGREVNTTGDGFVATFDAPTAAVRAALAIIEATQAAGIRGARGRPHGRV